MDAKNANRAIWIAGIASMLASFQLVILNNYMVIFLKEDLLTIIVIITIIISLRNLLQMVFRVPLGELSQIIGRKPLLLAGHFSYTTALFFMSIAESWIVVLIATICIAFGMSAFWPALFALIGDLTPENFGESNGKIFQLTDVGGIFGLLLSTIALDELSWDLKVLFGAIALLGILSGIISILILPEGLEKQNRKQVQNIFRAMVLSFLSLVNSLREITFTNRLNQVYAFQLLIAFIEFMSTAFLPVFIVEIASYSKGDVAEIGLWATLIIIWFKPFLGRITDKFKFLYTASFILIISSTLIFIFILIPNNILLIIFLYVLLNASLITGYTACNGETSRRSPDEIRGVALGALGFYVSLGRTASTAVLGPIWEFFGILNVFFFTACGVTIFTLFLFLVTKQRSGVENY